MIEEIPIPATLDAPGAADFIEMVAVRNATETFAFGSPDLEYTAEELLPGWLETEYEPKRLLVARADGHIVARGIYETRTAGSPDVAWFVIEVHPEFRRAGIGTALLARLEEFAQADGRSIHQTYGIAKELPGERLPSPTGFGSLPVADAGVGFLVKRGWRLEQVERASRLALPVHDIAAQFAAAGEASGPDYRVHTWVDRTSERWLPDLAMLATRMSTDAPSAGMETAEEVWTVERIVAAEELRAASPRHQLLAAVEHVPSGHLVGYTELSVAPQLDRAVGQQDTIVLKEHRGHRLGMLLKVANLEFLQRTYPGRPSVVTFNAEENRHMLAVNEAVGFIAVAYEGAWQRTR